MHRSLILAGIFLVPSFFLATNVFAQKEQAVVIGFGLGIHNYSETDDVRRDFFFLEDVGGLAQLYGEWYPFERLGFGLRGQSIGSSETLIFFGTEFTTEVDVNTLFITLQYLPFISDDGYVRIGLLGGIGPSTYEFTESQTIGGISDSQSSETSAPAVLGGVYIDWGGEDFGARFGINALRTDFDKLETPGLVTPSATELREVDGSGTNFYFDLRWAFG